MEKLVVKTAVKTVLAILLVVAVAFAIFNFAFPQHMATLTESSGNYSLAIRYASLRYTYTHDCKDLARCVDDSILAHQDNYIIQYGEELVAHKDFPAVCNEKNAKVGYGYDYRTQVMAKLAVAYYNKGDTVKAITIVTDVNGTDNFKYGNPFMSLCARIKTKGDATSAGQVLVKLEEITPANETEAGYLTQVKTSMKSVKLG